MTDPELAGIQAAFDYLSALDIEAQKRALKYLAKRLAESNRFFHISGLTDFPPPIQWTLAGNLAEALETPDEVVTELGEEMQVVEVVGVAAVEQRFAVSVPTGDGDCIDGYEIMWFATRSNAEAYLADAPFERADEAAP